jgi:bacterial/archaeal transporter family-2 protein
MTFETAILTLAAVLAGALVSVQSPINAGLAAGIGSPLAAATISFVVGTVALLALSGVLTRGVDIAALARLSPVLLLGGLLGAVFVMSNILLTPRIGVGAVVALGIAGQMIASLLLDKYGLLGLAERGLSTGRLTGALLVVGGALMVRFL